VLYDVRHQHGDVPAKAYDLKVLNAYTALETFQVVYWPTGFDEVEFESVCGLCLARGNMLLIVEEAQTFATKSRITPNFQKCISWGRMEGLGVISVCPRPANLHNDCIAQARHKFLFRTELTNDLDWLRGFLPKEVVEQLPNLKEYPEGNTDCIYVNGNIWRVIPPIPIS